MSHFSVAVFTKPEGKTVEELLAPYEEGEVAPYIQYTRSQAIEKGRKNMEDYKNGVIYQEYLKDPERYAKKCNNPNHIQYLENFEKKLQSTDEELYQEEAQWYEEDMIDEEGNLWSTYNPNSKWDWYSIGGRWPGMLKSSKGEFGEGSAFRPNPQKEGFFDSAKVKDIEFNDDFTTFAVVLPNGIWYEKGQMGWWACVSNADDNWNKNYKERFIDQADPEWTLTIVDCHI